MDKKEYKKTDYEHREIINQLIKTIADVRMEQGLKKILYMRIWGENKQIFKPMTHLQIAIYTGLSESQVRSLEEEAKSRVKNHIERHSLQDSINRFNESRALKNRIFDKA